MSKKITFEIGLTGRMFITTEKENLLLNVSPDDFDKLLKVIDKDKYGYMIGGNFVHADTYNYQFTNEELNQIINFIKDNLIKNEENNI